MLPCQDSSASFFGKALAGKVKQLDFAPEATTVEKMVASARKGVSNLRASGVRQLVCACMSELAASLAKDGLREELHDVRLLFLFLALFFSSRVP